MSIVRDGTFSRNSLLALLVLAPGLAGCSGASDIFSRDADWFSRPGRVFIRNISIESPPLTPDKPVTNDDLVSADGSCPGMAPPPGAGECAGDRCTAAAADRRQCRTRAHRMRRRARHRRPRQCEPVQRAGRRARCGRDLVARSARRHLYLQFRAPDVGRARPGCCAGAEARKAEEEAEEAGDNLERLSCKSAEL